MRMPRGGGGWQVVFGGACVLRVRDGDLRRWHISEMAGGGGEEGRGPRFSSATDRARAIFCAVFGGLHWSAFLLVKAPETFPLFLSTNAVRRRLGCGGGGECVCCVVFSRVPCPAVFTMVQFACIRMGDK